MKPIGSHHEAPHASTPPAQTSGGLSEGAWIATAPARRIFSPADRTSVIEVIIDRLQSGIPLAAICRDPAMPCPNTVRAWCAEDETLTERIARARADGCDVLLSETLEIADLVTEDPASRKVRVWARLEALKRFDPARYGDHAASTTVNVGVRVGAISEEERKLAIERKRRAVQRRRARLALEQPRMGALADGA